MKLFPRVALLLTTAFAPLLTHCSSQYGSVSYATAPKVINVSEWDPKEKQRAGDRYSTLDQRALKKNGSHGLIARCAKGYTNDNKCASFLVGAERQGMRIGTYYYILPHLSARRQAVHYLDRLRKIKSSHGLQSQSVLLAADFDTKCSSSQMAAFVKEIHRRTGVYPLVYLENSEGVRQELRNASSSQKAILRRCPYWLALYSNTYPGIATPKKLAQASGVWSNWAMWQYGGVFWENGRSKVHNYQGGSWQTPKYFGTVDRPLERNGFNGSTAELYAFWDKHSWEW